VPVQPGLNALEGPSGKTLSRNQDIPLRDRRARAIRKLHGARDCSQGRKSPDATNHARRSSKKASRRERVELEA